MFEARAKVTVSLPSGLKWVEKLVDGHVDRVKLPTDYLQLSENEILFAATELHSWGGGFQVTIYETALAKYATGGAQRVGPRLLRPRRREAARAQLHLCPQSPGRSNQL